MVGKSKKSTDEEYLAVLRNISPQRKLDMVFEMWETALELRAMSIRYRFPNLKEEEVQKKVVEELIACHKKN